MNWQAWAQRVIDEFAVYTEALSPERRLFLLTGLLGGFTTFSTFGYDTARLLTSGAGILAMVNALVSVGAGVTAIILGLWAGRHWLVAS